MKFDIDALIQEMVQCAKDALTLDQDALAADRFHRAAQGLAQQRATIRAYEAREAAPKYYTSTESLRQMLASGHLDEDSAASVAAALAAREMIIP